MTADGINYLLASHPRLLGILVFWGEIFMGPVQTGAVGHLTVLLLLRIFQEMMADYMHKKGTREWLFVQDEF